MVITHTRVVVRVRCNRNPRTPSPMALDEKLRPKRQPPKDTRYAAVRWGLLRQENRQHGPQEIPIAQEMEPYPCTVVCSVTSTAA